MIPSINKVFSVIQMDIHIIVTSIVFAIFTNIIVITIWKFFYPTQDQQYSKDDDYLNESNDVEDGMIILKLAQWTFKAARYNLEVSSDFFRALLEEDDFDEAQEIDITVLVSSTRATNADLKHFLHLLEGKTVLSTSYGSVFDLYNYKSILLLSRAFMVDPEKPFVRGLEQRFGAEAVDT